MASGPLKSLITRAAGGRLLGLASCAELNSCPGVVYIDGGGFDAYQREHPAVADGTVLIGLPSGTEWRIVSGSDSASRLQVA